MRSSDGFERTDMGTIFLWEHVQEQAKSLKLRIEREGPHFHVYPTEEFMGKRTASPGGRLTSGLSTLEGLCAFLAGVEAIIRREEMIQSLIRVPEKVIEIDPQMKQIQDVQKSPEPNDVRNMGLALMCACLQEIFDVLYWDSGARAYDPDKEWDSRTIEEVADAIIRRGVEPQKGD